MTLAEFLLARLAEDEAVARDAAEVQPIHSTRWQLSTIKVETIDGVTHERPRGTVEARPPRVLAECEAKRRIVELHSQDEHDCVEMHHGVYPADWPVEAAWGKAGEPWAHPSLEYQVGPCPTLLALAQPYVDHPDFRDEWRL